MTGNSAEPKRHWLSILLGLFIYQLYLIALSVGYLLLELHTVIPFSVYRFSFYAYLVLIPLGAIAYIYDRKISEEPDEWIPSHWLFIITLPFVVNVAFSGLYVYRRYQASTVK